MKRSKFLAAALMLALALGCLTACKDDDTAKADFSGYKKVAELATIECEYHNVAEYNDSGAKLPFNISVGYKKAWFEYDGTVQLGLDVSKVVVSEPNADNEVTITIPQAKVIGDPQPDESSFSDVYVESGALTTVGIEDKTAAYETAVEKMRESASSDESLLSMAEDRAKTLLESYVKKIGDLNGETYSVVWNELDES